MRRNSTFSIFTSICFIFRFFAPLEARTLTTLHGRQDLGDLKPFYYRFREMPLVSVSSDQRKPLPHANFVATIHHGIPTDLRRPSFEQGNYLAPLRFKKKKKKKKKKKDHSGSGVPLRIRPRGRRGRHHRQSGRSGPDEVVEDGHRMVGSEDEAIAALTEIMSYDRRTVRRQIRRKIYCDKNGRRLCPYLSPAVEDAHGQ